MNTNIVKNSSIYNISRYVFDGKQMRILPTSEWEKFSWLEIRLLMHYSATYVIPTSELIETLKHLIGDNPTIEIGAGNGWIGRALGIPLTDSFQQRDDPETVMMYTLMRQPLIQYPDDIIKMEALEAVEHFHPHTVLGAYITHRWEYGMSNGNMHGVDFKALLSKVRRLILVGNLNTHADNPLMYYKHQEIQLPGLITRSEDPSSNRIFIWENK